MKKEKVLKLLKDEVCYNCDWLARFAKTKEPACLLRVSTLPKNLMCDDFEKRKKSKYFDIDEITVLNDKERDNKETS